MNYEKAGKISIAIDESTDISLDSGNLRKLLANKTTQDNLSLLNTNIDIGKLKSCSEGCNVAQILYGVQNGVFFLAF